MSEKEEEEEIVDFHRKSGKKKARQRRASSSSPARKQRSYGERRQRSRGQNKQHRRSRAAVTESSRDRRDLSGPLRPLVLAFFRRRWFMLDVFYVAKRRRQGVFLLAGQGKTAPINSSYLCCGRLEPGRRRSLVRESRGAHPFSLRVHAAHGCCLRWCLRCLRGEIFENRKRE